MRFSATSGPDFRTGSGPVPEFLVEFLEINGFRGETVDKCVTVAKRWKLVKVVTSRSKLVTFVTSRRSWWKLVKLENVSS